MTATTHDRSDARPLRPVGGILLGGLVASLLWRILLAPALLGEFNSAAMPGDQRALLALGLLASALVAATGLATLARALRETGAGRAVAGAAAASFAGAALLATQIALLFAGAEFLGLFQAFGFLTTGAWLVASAALVRAGILRWVSLLTGLLSALAMVSLLAGAMIIFVMFIATLPLALGLLLRRPRPVASTAMAHGHAV